MIAKFLSPLGVVALGMLLQQTPDPPEAYPGQSAHAQPPAGWTCSPTAKAEHECHCTRMAHPEEICAEAEPDPQECRVYCWAHAKWLPPDATHPKGHYESSHCACPVTCSTDGHQHGGH